MDLRRPGTGPRPEGEPAGSAESPCRSAPGPRLETRSTLQSRACPAVRDTGLAERRGWAAHHTQRTAWRVRQASTPTEKSTTLGMLAGAYGARGRAVSKS